MILISLTLFFFLRLTYEIQKEKQQYTILISLGNLSYDQDFLKKASKINRLQGIWPVVEIPVAIKIEDYTKATVFCGIDLNAFTEISGQDNLGNTPRLLLGSNSLENMKDSNGHTISKKQQNKYLKMRKQLAITYTLDSIDSNKSSTEYSSSISDSSFTTMDSPGAACKTSAARPGFPWAGPSAGSWPGWGWPRAAGGRGRSCPGYAAKSHPGWAGGSYQCARRVYSVPSLPARRRDTKRPWASVRPPLPSSFQRVCSAAPSPLADTASRRGPPAPWRSGTPAGWPPWDRCGGWRCGPA